MPARRRPLPAEVHEEDDLLAELARIVTETASDQGRGEVHAEGGPRAEAEARPRAEARREARAEARREARGEAGVTHRGEAGEAGEPAGGRVAAATPVPPRPAAPPQPGSAAGPSAAAPAAEDEGDDFDRALSAEIDAVLSRGATRRSLATPTFAGMPAPARPVHAETETPLRAAPATHRADAAPPRATVGPAETARTPTAETARAPAAETARAPAAETARAPAADTARAQTALAPEVEHEPAAEEMPTRDFAFDLDLELNGVAETTVAEAAYGSGFDLDFSLEEAIAEAIGAEEADRAESPRREPAQEDGVEDLPPLPPRQAAAPPAAGAFPSVVPPPPAAAAPASPPVSARSEAVPTPRPASPRPPAPVTPTVPAVDDEPIFDFSAAISPIARASAKPAPIDPIPVDFDELEAGIGAAAKQSRSGPGTSAQTVDVDAFEAEILSGLGSGLRSTVAPAAPRRPAPLPPSSLAGLAIGDGPAAPRDGFLADLGAPRRPDVDPEEPEPAPIDDETAPSKPRRVRRRSPAMLAAAAVAVVAAAGGVAYVILDFGGSSIPEVPPVISADGSPDKIPPAEAEQNASAGPAKAVFDKVADANDPGAQRLDREEVVIPPGDDTAKTDTDLPGVATGEEPAPDAAETTPDSPPIEPKKVRTVVVKPDGTVIASSDAPETAEGVGRFASTTAAVAGSGYPEPGALGAPGTIGTPPATGGPPAVPGRKPLVIDGTADFKAPPGSIIVTQGTAPPAADAAAGTETAAAAVAPADATPAETTEAVAGFDGPPPPLPPQRPPVPLRTVAAPGAVAPTTAAATSAAVAATPPAASPSAPAATGGPLVLTPQASAPAQPAAAARAPAAAAPAPVAAPTATPAVAGSVAVQLASQKTEAEALRAFADLQRRFPSILGGRQPSVVAATVGDRGTFYRVRVSESSAAAANDLCSQLKAAGGDCFVTRN